MTIDRRNFLKLLGAGAGAGSLYGCAGAPAVSVVSEILPKTGRRVVVIGGGYGGTIAAKYVRMYDRSIEVVLIERNRQFVSCPFSNLYIGGIMKDLTPLTIGYDKLAANHGIKMVYDEVTAIDPAAKKVVVRGGTIAYDQLIVSPGVDFRLDEIKGYDPKQTPDVMPHAWKAGEQTLLLRNQLVAMKDGGTVLITVPLTPYRCPPGPYERASMIAMYLKQAKPKSKLIVLDSNPDIVSKAGLFKKGWAKHYQGILEYRGAKKVTEVDTKSKTVLVEGLEAVTGDVINLIPPQRAGHIAVAAGLVGPDKNWCPVNPTTFESTIHKGIHVIGDASIAGAMPKSGYSANSQAKACALNLVAAMNGKELTEFSGINTCYSFITAKEAVEVTGVYKVDKGAIVAAAGSVGVSPDLSELEAIYAESWLKNILTEMST
ncbi:MAG: FCSD flavin-binding domain-containing protein [Betaproteobacteria bacterium]|nr:FCSD flavin-binding domain-containing protein [Betaproteobacteria bacterium]